MVAKKSISRMISGLFVTIFILSATPFQPVRAGGIRYVKPDLSANGDCSGWDNACTLQTALTGAIDSDEIWVAAGIYLPGTLPTDTFQLKNGVALYGGFAGTETARDQRDFALNITSLSGDLNGDDNDNVASDEPTREDNSYHVVTGATGATLDGFTITAGNANNVHSDESGGGMLNESIDEATNTVTNGNEVSKASSSPLTLTNITFIDNTAYMAGGGMYNEGDDPALTNVLFTGNSAQGGGGMYNEYSSPTLTNVNFSGNTASLLGGGMMNEACNSPMVTNVTFSGNSAQVGGGMYNDNSVLTVMNVDFIGNSAEFYGAGMANDFSIPTLTNVTFSRNTVKTGGYAGGGMSNSGSSSILTTVTFSENSATWGGGMYNEMSNPTLTNTTFTGNTATLGGGMFNRDESGPNLTNVTFNNNSAIENGGGMYNQDGHNPVLANVTFNNNSAIKNGGGIYNEDFLSSWDYISLTLKNVTLSENSAQNGGGMYNSTGNPTLIGVTFNDNMATFYGGGMYNDYSIADIRNTIFWGNTASSGGAQISNFYESELNMSYSVIQDGGVDGTNIITTDPKLGSLGNYGGFTRPFPS